MENCASLTTLITDLDRHNKQIDQFLGEGKYEEAADQIDVVEGIIRQKEAFLHWRSSKVAFKTELKDVEGYDQVFATWPIKVFGEEIVCIDGDSLRIIDLSGKEIAVIPLRAPGLRTGNPDFIMPRDFVHGENYIYLLGSYVNNGGEMEEGFFEISHMAGVTKMQGKTPLLLGGFRQSNENVAFGLSDVGFASFEPGVLSKFDPRAARVNNINNFRANNYDGSAFERIIVDEPGHHIYTVNKNKALDAWDVLTMQHIRTISKGVDEWVSVGYEQGIFLKDGKISFFYLPDVIFTIGSDRKYEKATVLKDGEGLFILAPGDKVVDVYKTNDQVSSFSLAKYVGESEIKTFEMSESGKLVLGLSDGKIKVLEWDKMEE